MDKLYNLGFGRWENGKLVLTNIEKHYCYENGLIKEDINLNEKEMEIYKIYKYIRDKGYVVKPTNYGYLRVYRKGYTKYEKHRLKYLVKIVNENKLNIKEDLDMIYKTRAKLVYAFPNLTFIKCEYIEF